MFSRNHDIFDQIHENFKILHFFLGDMFQKYGGHFSEKKKRLRQRRGPSRASRNPRNHFSSPPDPKNVCVKVRTPLPRPPLNAPVLTNFNGTATYKNPKMIQKSWLGSCWDNFFWVSGRDWPVMTMSCCAEAQLFLGGWASKELNSLDESFG